jgi:hypothetical protein
LGSSIGNEKLSVVVMPSSISCAQIANSSKDFSLMHCKIYHSPQCTHWIHISSIEVLMSRSLQ